MYGYVLYMHIGVLYKLWYSLSAPFQNPWDWASQLSSSHCSAWFLVSPPWHDRHRQTHSTQWTQAPAERYWRSTCTCHRQRRELRDSTQQNSQRFTGQILAECTEVGKKRGFLMLMAGATGHRLNNDGYGNYESIWILSLLRWSPERSKRHRDSCSLRATIDRAKASRDDL